jgi:hypothetical protein
MDPRREFSEIFALELSRALRQIIRRKFVRRQEPELALVIAPLLHQLKVCSNVVWLHPDC